MTENKKLQVWLPFLFSIVLVMGMVLGYQLNRTGGKKGLFTSGGRNTLQEALDLIRFKYVDSVSLDSLEGRALEEMMALLDPHSVYLTRNAVKEANEELAGNFQGIGVEFNLFSDTVHVIFVMPGGPGEKAGLRPGDRILRVDDVPLSGNKITADKVRQSIRGPKGTIANLRIARDGRPMDIAVTRGTIPVSAVDAAYLIDGTTGYIRLNKFSENSYEEFMKALEGLKKEGLQQLILDLRGNGGGYMSEAVDIADEFLDGDKLVVYMQGANLRKREYRCRRPGLLEKGRLVVLVDEQSASASEVLAGALQDWCRARVIGRRTFGKGLVQEQYGLQDGSALRLTIARYFTPLGRSIQRSYEKGKKKIYLNDLAERYQNGEMYSSDSIHGHLRGIRYANACGDTLYGGAGILPDVFVPLDSSLYQSPLDHFISGGTINRYIYNYYLEHQIEISRYERATALNADTAVPGLWEGFLEMTRSDSVRPGSLSRPQQERLRLQLKALLARYRWRNQGYYELLNASDPLLQKALNELHR